MGASKQSIAEWNSKELLAAMLEPSENLEMIEEAYDALFEVRMDETERATAEADDSSAPGLMHRWVEEPEDDMDIMMDKGKVMFDLHEFSHDRARRKRARLAEEQGGEPIEDEGSTCESTSVPSLCYREESSTSSMDISEEWA